MAVNSLLSLYDVLHHGVSITCHAERGDKDARDLRDMEVEKRLRVGEGLDMIGGGMGGFEQHTKGIGSKLLKKSGWMEGSGVGISSQGILEPLEAEGQHPHSKRGLG